MIKKFLGNISDLLVGVQTDYPRLYDILNFIYQQLVGIIDYLESEITFGSYTDYNNIAVPSLDVNQKSRVFCDDRDGKLKIIEIGDQPRIVNIDGYYFTRFIDDFVDFTNATDNRAGNLLWQISGTAATVLKVFISGSGHPGVSRLTTGNVNGNRVGLFLNARVDHSQIRTIKYLVRIPNTIANVEMYCGIGDTAAADYLGAEAVGFAFNAGSANWILFGRTGSVNTTVDSGVAVAVDTWYKLEMRSHGGSTISGFSTANEWEFYINDVFVGYISSGLPTTTQSLGPCMGIQTNTGAVREGDVDLFIGEYDNLGTRY